MHVAALQDFVRIQINFIWRLEITSQDTEEVRARQADTKHKLAGKRGSDQGLSKLVES
jgi:hypothetical protein